MPQETHIPSVLCFAALNVLAFSPYAHCFMSVPDSTQVFKAQKKQVGGQVMWAVAFPSVRKAELFQKPPQQPSTCFNG